MRARSMFGILAVVGLASAANAQIVLNEIYVNPGGTDDAREYVEICGPAGSTISNLWLIEIEGDGTGAGVIDSVRNLSGLSFGSSGLLMLGEGYETSVPWGVVAGTNYYNLNRGTPSTLENGSITFLLVSDFTGAVSNDLDTDNNGTFESTPWSSIVDGIGWAENDTGVNLFYGAGLGPFVGSFTPDAASRYPTDTSANSAAAWWTGDIDGTAGPLAVDYDQTRTAGGVFPGARLTPGSKNVPAPGSLALLGLGGLVAARRRRA
jgi:MYXO-CTERM domain-containing protein